MERLRAVVARGLFATERLWDPLKRAQMWLVRAAEVLAHEEQADATRGEGTDRELLAEVLTAKSDAGVAEGATTFYQVSRS